ncbi:hypothetical protein LRD18_06305 [Halorhodospira halochloris]|uniref:hypothetical protein n=1 Tax=Halorhodospira halochloris TaxID=1052 RepID=UPI001EE8B4E7|nr:hypothetical protein [Halorhodospira halochloris]MCG5530484.1 hypothetical protein [Halorhodospira halochloris]
MRKSKNLLNVAALTLALSVPGAAIAETIKSHVGGALYGSAIQVSGYSDDEFSGLALFGTGVINDNAGIRGVLAAQEHNDNSDVDSTILEGTVLFGSGLGTEGFKAYIGPGLFSDSFDYPGGDFDASGLHIMFGLGYNWSGVALDAWWSVRDVSDYEDELGVTVDGVASFG